MSTQSSTRNIFPPVDNPELTIRRRPRVDHTLLNNFEMATNGNGDDVPPPGGVERETVMTKDTMPPTNNESTKDVQPLVVQIENKVLNVEPVVAPVSAPKPKSKPLILYPSRLYDQKLRDKTNDQKEKFFQIFQDLNFNISFTDALILWPNLGRSRGKHKSHAIIRVEQAFPSQTVSYVYDTCTRGSFDFSSGRGHRRCLRKSRNVPFPGRLSSRSFDTDPRVPLILRRSFIKTSRALIDVYKEELTLPVGKEAVTFNLDQTLRYSANYDATLVNRIDLIDVACEEYSQEVLGFFMSGNPTPSTEPIISTSSPTLTPFGDSDFLLEKPMLS
nr:reverse transcriptase domain-containing protein [Tanacetum cinerariifolium]